MKREWMAALGAVAVGALAVGGYWYADRELRAAAETGMQRINAFYAARKMPPVTYERLETHVFSLSATLFNLRQNGTVTTSDVEQILDSVIARAEISKGRGDRIDVVLEDLKVSSQATILGADQDLRMETVVAVEREEMKGLDLAAIDTQGRPTDPLAWFDKVESRGIAGHMILSQEDGEDEPFKVDFTAADAGADQAENGLHRIFLNGTQASTSGGVSLGMRSLSMRLRPSDALGRLMDMANSADEAAIRATIAECGRALAGFAVEGVEATIPGEADPVRLDAASIDELNWRDGILTDLAFRIDHFRLALPSAMPDDQRALLEASGLTRIDHSMSFGLHYAPDAGTLRLAPLTATTEGLLSSSLTAGFDNLHLPKVALGDAAQQQAARMQMAAAAISAVPTPISLQLRDLGGVKKMIAALAAQNGVSADAMVQGWSAMVLLQASAVMAPEAAAGLARDIRAFLTDKSVLNVRIAPRGALSLAAMTAMPPAQAIEVSSSAE